MSMHPQVVYELARLRQEELRRQAARYPRQSKGLSHRHLRQEQGLSVRRLRAWPFRAPAPRSAPVR